MTTGGLDIADGVTVAEEASHAEAAVDASDDAGSSHAEFDGVGFDDGGNLQRGPDRCPRTRGIGGEHEQVTVSDDLIETAAVGVRSGSH